jgi:hypothetical protein
MPIPQVSCGVCKSTVNKRQTILVGSSRVCRSHQEAVDHKRVTAEREAEERGKKAAYEEQVNTLVSRITTMAKMKELSTKEAIAQFGPMIPAEPKELKNEVIKRVMDLDKQASNER